MEQQIDSVQAQAGDQDGCYGHHDHGRSVSQFEIQNGPFVFAKKLLNAFQRNGVDVPCVPRNVRHVGECCIRWRMKSVVHAGCQAQCHVSAIFQVKPIKLERL
jgi:hypothetical protein